MWPSGTNTVQTQLWMSSPLTGQTSTVEARASVCLRGLNPMLHPHLMLLTLFTLWSHVPRSATAALAEAVSFPMPPPLSFCRCCRGLFVFRGPLFSSVASVSCSSTSGFTCLCVRLFQAVGQLNLLGASTLMCSSRTLDGVLLPGMLWFQTRWWTWSYTQNISAPAECLILLLHLKWRQNSAMCL